MIFKDLEALANAYGSILNESKKPDQDKDGVPDWADKHPGKDDKKKSTSKKEEEQEDKPKAKKKLPFVKEEKSSFRSLYDSVMSEDKKLSFNR